jgi:hypothetical protein
MRVMLRLLAVVALSAFSDRARSATDLDACQAAFQNDDPATQSLCKRAWDATHDVAAAVAGANDALMDDDYEALKGWASIAPADAQGARILHFWGEMQGKRGELDGAERTLRRTLELRRALDPERAWNTAMVLLSVVRYHRPAAESIELARRTWVEAPRGEDPIPRAMTAAALAEVLVDLGELKTAQLVIEQITDKDSYLLRMLSQGRLEAAHSHVQTATQQLAIAAAARDDQREMNWRLNAQIELAHALLRSGRIAEASAAANAAEKSAKQADVQTDFAGKLAAVRAAFALARDDVAGALAATDRGLALKSRDAARVKLLNVRGEALARRGEWKLAEAAWRESADEIEAWRASIPALDMREGILANHRHALEAWLDSAAARGDAAVATEVVQRIIGRGLLDRMHDRESNTADPTRAVQDVATRLVARQQLAATPRIASVHKFVDTPRDVVVLISGARTVWAIRHASGRWTIDAAGARGTIKALVDEYRRVPDDAIVAERLGSALFPASSLPRTTEPLVVILDRDLADVPLGGLRTGGRFLVEHAAIVELLVPELIFFEDSGSRSWGASVALGDPDGDLPAAAREVARVGRAISATPAIGKAATPQALLGAATARTLHVATHSAVEGGRAAFVLSGGAVTAYDIVKHRVAPRLAVIATCRSQVDDDPEHSLVAAFLAAGTSGVVGVKRAIDDADGERFIADFYSANGDNDPVVALAAAQRNAIHAGRPPHTWAAFSFFGTGAWLNNPR